LLEREGFRSGAVTGAVGETTTGGAGRRRRCPLVVEVEGDLGALVGASEYAALVRCGFDGEQSHGSHLSIVAGLMLGPVSSRQPVNTSRQTSRITDTANIAPVIQAGAGLAYGSRCSWRTVTGRRPPQGRASGRRGAHTRRCRTC